MEIDFTSILIVAMSAITGVILGIKWLNTRANGSKPLKKEVEYWKEYALEAEAEIKHWKGKFNKRDQPPQFDGQFTKENLPDIIGDFFPMFSQFVPKFAQPFFRQPALQKLIVDWCLKNPDQAAELIGKFFGHKGGKPFEQNQANTGSNSPQITPEIY